MSEAVFGLIGVILGSLLTASKDVVTFLLQRREVGRVHAVGIITVLDAYADQCSSIVSDDGTAYGRPAGMTAEGEEYPDPQEALPEPPIYPDDVDWRSIKFDLMYRALALQNTARDTNSYIQSCSEHASPPGYDELFAARQEGYARLGLEAVQLASALREQHRLPAPGKPFWDWGFEIGAFFQTKIAEFETRQKAAEERHKALLFSEQSPVPEALSKVERVSRLDNVDSFTRNETSRT
ncbi:hypothetical protein [Aquidulcibacter paucihalophilus]|uniref:hypothetical protein n=1 Tax=Aquidulcibacter paucihalophilus TaxID=1978549 RepID=UPI000A18BD1F|nr:hypothetical protein [Aquidulcibacter paucihalophilus]